jgi:hypothetical protein
LYEPTKNGPRFTLPSVLRAVLKAASAVAPVVETTNSRPDPPETPAIASVEVSPITAAEAAAQTALRNLSCIFSPFKV